MKLPNPTAGLWLGNAFGILLLLLIVAYQIGGAVFDMNAPLPKVQPLAAQPIHQPEPQADIGNRNPFDSSAARWKTDAEKNSALSGELRGVIMLPGVKAVVTKGGAVHLGEALAEGRITKIMGDKIIVEQGDASREMELPSAHRPTLRSLNKANTGLDHTKAAK